MIGVDTNVLIYAVNADEPAHERCLDILSGTRPVRDVAVEQLGVPWSVVYEFLRVVTHPRVLPTVMSMDQAWGFIADLQQREHVTMLAAGPGHARAAGRVLRAPGVRGNLVHDAHIAAVLAEHGVRRIYTRDQDFRRFPGLEVVDPLA